MAESEVTIEKAEFVNRAGRAVAGGVRRPSTLETVCRTFACFGALAVYGILGFFFLFTQRGRGYLISTWMPMWARTNLALLGIRLRIVGEENLRTARSTIFVSNHQGLLDIFSVPSILKSIPMFWIVKSEFRLYPFIGQLAILTDQVFLNRRSGPGNRQPLAKAIRKLQDGMCTVMFPEGTRRSERSLQAFKKGAFWLAMDSECLIVPITLVNSGELLPNRTWDLTQGVLEIVVDEPIDTRGWTSGEIPRQMERVRKIMLGNLERQVRV